MSLQIAVIQLNNYIADRERSFAAAEKLIVAAASQGASIAALPELSSCGYVPNDDIWRLGEPPFGDTAAWACEIAKRYAVYIGAGYLEYDGLDFYNAYLIAAPTGKVAGRVHKMKPETYCFRPSDIGSVIDTDIGRIAVGICADNHGKWFYDRLKGLPFDLLLMPHAWPTPFAASKYISQRDVDESRENVRTLGQVYADGFGVPVAFVNAVGEVPRMRGILGRFISSDCFRLQGGSAIFPPEAETVRCADGEGFALAEISLGRRNTAAVEPAVYGGWLHPGSRLTRKILIPLDTMLGERYYDKRAKVRKDDRSHA